MPGTGTSLMFSTRIFISCIKTSWQVLEKQLVTAQRNLTEAQEQLGGVLSQS